MNKKEYMQKLEHYMKCYGYTPYDYFNQFALKLKGYMRYEFEDWEMSCPFLTDDDYKKLLYTDEENIIYYFATAMAKVIELDRLELKKDSDVKLLGGSSEVKLLPGKVEEPIITRKVEEKEEIHEEDSLSRKDIEDEINLQFNKDSLSREDLEEVINSKLSDEFLNREDIESVINEQLDEEYLSRDDISSIIDENLEKTRHTSVFYKLGKKISRFLKSLVVMNEVDHSNLYYYDPEKGSLEDKMPFDKRYHDGVYVNFEEYMNRVLDSVVEKYQNVERVTFVNSEGVEEDYHTFCEKAFTTLRKAGAIRFGNEVISQKITSYQDLVNLHLEKESNFGSHLLKQGFYVNSDVLEKVMSEHQIKVYTLENECTDEFTNRK